MPPPPAEILPVRTSADVVLVRQAVRALCTKIGLSLIDQTKLVTAASELARNALEHGGGGSVRIEVLTRGNKNGVRAVFEDHGPGIADVAAAMTDGYSTGAGMGLGLSGSRRLVSEFELETQAGQGTRVTITKWK